MATAIRLIRPAGSLARPPSSRHHSLTSSSSSILFPVSRTFTSTAIVKDNKAKDSQDSNSKVNGIKDSVSKDGLKSQGSIASETTTAAESTEVAAAAERQRIMAEEASLKEILESAAAEKKKLEEELVRQQRLAAEQEQRRLAAIKEAEEAAARAEAEAAAKKAKEAEAAAAKQNKRMTQQFTGKTTRPSQGSTETSAASVSKPSSASSSSSLESETTADRLEESLASTSSTSVGSMTSSEPSASTSAPFSSIAAKGSSSQSTQRDNEFIEDPLEPFKARLLPYKKSLASSTEYIRSSLPDSLRQLQESVKRKDYRDMISQLSGHLNSFTGYNAINDLKHKVINHGDALDKARISLLQSKQAYEDAIRNRSDTQKAINDLLQRKHLWSPDDVIRFTDLYRSEHANEQAEQKTRSEYKQAEANVEEKSRKLTRVIMERYHEEQVWSDKIRAASTYGTWGLVGVNVMAFLIVQAFVEPRRRRKQVERYEELVEDLTERGILPDKSVAFASPSSSGSLTSGQSGGMVTGSPTTESSTDSTKAGVAVAIGGALLGGEDVLVKMIQSAERQEERLERLEALLTKSSKATPFDDNNNTQTSTPPAPTPSYTVADDGTILFGLQEDEENVNLGTDVYLMGDDERVVFGSQSGGVIFRSIEQPGQENGSRFKRVLSDGGQEVLATRRDFLISGLGGAIVGGLVTFAVMMYK
ncbi:sensitivity to high expression protein she9 [Gryganskiella cystojenkinii]|nr:sensitivity to high expression protein she9 [Gryganskiella cystojenkinii]